MAKAGKLGKLLKKMQSIGKTTNRASISRGFNSNRSDDSSEMSPSGNNLCPVYVGKSRRRYLVSSDVLDHPLFRELVERSSPAGEEITVGCEVVLFEHLLWMLENADPQPESLDELVDFYAC